MDSPARKPAAAPSVARPVALCRLAIAGRGVINYPADLREAALVADRSAMPLLHRGRPPETIGQTMQRRMDRVPEPFSANFAARLEATLLAEPAFARVLRAVLAQGGQATEAPRPTLRIVPDSQRATA